MRGFLLVGTPDPSSLRPRRNFAATGRISPSANIRQVPQLRGAGFRRRSLSYGGQALLLRELFNEVPLFEVAMAFESFLQRNRILLR